MFNEMMPQGPPGPPMGSEPPMPPPEEEQLPVRAKVQRVEGDMVFIIAEDGREINLPLEAFIFPPEPGAELIKAEVVGIEGDSMMVEVEGEVVQLPLKEGFNPGDLFWMPALPMGPADDVPLGAEMPTEQGMMFE